MTTSARRPSPHLYGLLMGLTAATAVLGFVREAAIGAFFGASRATDAYYAAIALPFVAAFFLVGGAMVPPVTASLAACLAHDRRAEAMAILGRAMLAILAVGIPSALAIGLFSEPVCGLLAPGFAPADRALMARLLVSLLPYGLGTAIFLLFSAALTAAGSYRLPIAASFAGHAVSVVVLVAARARGIDAAAWGMSLGALASVALAFAGLASARLSPFSSPSRAARLPLREMGVLVVALAAAGAVDLVERGLASGAAIGTVAILAFASKLVHLAMRLVAAPIASVAFPRLVRGRAREDRGSHEEAGQAGAWIVRILLFCAAITAAAPLPIARVTFGRGRFDAEAVALLARTLVWLAPAIIAVGVVEYATKYLLAASRTRAVAIAQLVGLLTYVAVAPRLRVHGLGGLAAARSLAWTLVALTLLVALRASDRRLATFPRPIVAIVGLALPFAAASWLLPEIPGPDVIRLALAALVGAVGYFGLLLFVRRAPEAST